MLLLFPHSGIKSQCGKVGLNWWRDIPCPSFSSSADEELYCEGVTQRRLSPPDLCFLSPVSGATSSLLFLLFCLCFGLSFFWICLHLLDCKFTSWFNYVFEEEPALPLVFTFKNLQSIQSVCGTGLDFNNQMKSLKIRSNKIWVIR